VLCMSWQLYAGSGLLTSSAASLVSRLKGLRWYQKHGLKHRFRVAFVSPLALQQLWVAVHPVHGSTSSFLGQSALHTRLLAALDSLRFIASSSRRVERMALCRHWY
jgi:hypothetical protein